MKYKQTGELVRDCLGALNYIPFVFPSTVRDKSKQVARKTACVKSVCRGVKPANFTFCRVDARSVFRGPISLLEETIWRSEGSAPAAGRRSCSLDRVQRMAKLLPLSAHSRDSNVSVIWAYSVRLRPAYYASVT